MLKFSLAHLLILIAVISVFSGFLSFADGGSQIAVGLLYALPLMAIPMLIMAVFYWIAFSLSKEKVEPQKYHSPDFGPDQLGG